MSKVAGKLEVVVLVSALLLAPRAHAQDRDPAAAQALFDEGRTLMNAKRYEEACSKLAESLRLDPGIGTQFHLATCYEHAGKVASAWAAFLEVASLATASGQDERAQTANRRAALLGARLPRLTVVVAPNARASGLEITRDGIVVGEAQWGLPMPVDPGVHALEVTAPGKKAFAGAVTVSEGGAEAFDVPVLEATSGVVIAAVPAASPPQAVERASAPIAAPVHEQPKQDAALDEPSSGPGALVITLGVVGVVGLGVGTVFGIIATTANTSSKEHCDSDNENLCTEEGGALRDDAFLYGNTSTVAFIVGGVALAGAGTLWLLGVGSESDDRAAISVDAGPTGARIAMRGSF